MIKPRVNREGGILTSAFSEESLKAIQRVEDDLETQRSRRLALHDRLSLRQTQFYFVVAGVQPKRRTDQRQEIINCQSLEHAQLCSTQIST